MLVDLQTGEILSESRKLTDVATNERALSHLLYDLMIIEDNNAHDNCVETSEWQEVEL